MDHYICITSKPVTRFRLRRTFRNGKGPTLTGRRRTDLFLHKPRSFRQTLVVRIRTLLVALSVYGTVKDRRFIRDRRCMEIWKGYTLLIRGLIRDTFPKDTEDQFS